MNFKHYGLYFTEEQLRQARSQAKVEPFQAAFALLREYKPSEALPAIQLQGLRYLVDRDLNAGEQAINGLQDLVFDDDTPYLDSLASLLEIAQCFEQVRDHPAFSRDIQSHWLNMLSERVNILNQPMFDVSYVERLWLGALNIGVGIVLEREDLFQAGADLYQQVIREDIRPEGYIPKAVDGKDGQTLHRQLLAVSALVLMAEMASHVDAKLWEFDHRGVSVITAVTYMVYYYFYPEKWKWDDGLELEPTQRLYREHGGFWEIVNRRTQPKSINLLLNDLRPIYDPYGGGLTTLTHGLITRKRGLFG